MKNVSKVDEEVQLLQARIDALRKNKEAELKELRLLNPRVWRFTFTRVPDNKVQWDKSRDPQCWWYSLAGEVVNREKLTEFYSDDFLRGGSMRYLWNNATGRIVGAFGGGHIFIVDHWAGVSCVREKVLAQQERVYSELEAFVKAHPEGGDVTDIINSQEGKGWA